MNLIPDLLEGTSVKRGDPFSVCVGVKVKTGLKPARKIDSKNLIIRKCIIRSSFTLFSIIFKDEAGDFIRFLQKGM